MNPPDATVLRADASDPMPGQGTENPTARAGASRSQPAAATISRIVLLGATFITIGILWDISWHRTIGRDTFWTPAHLAIQLGGLLGGLSAAWLILRTTLAGSAAEKRAGVSIWGMHGPLGAWICAWGALAMVTSAPFDNWWHDAYGLDVKILSPPHTVLAAGMFAIVIGALLLVLRDHNLGGQAGRPGGGGLVLYAGGVILTMTAVFLVEESWPNQQRNRIFYVISCATFPLYLMAVARASSSRWGATWAAAGYMAIGCLMTWILPLFPGQPRLGPIYNPVDHFVPLAFPLLLVVPAFGIDCLRNWIGHGRGALRDWVLCLLGGAVFTGLFILTQWHFAAFLIGPGGQNWFFGANRHWDYNSNLTENQYRFWSETGPQWNVPASVGSLVLAGVLAVVACRLGLWLGNWMTRVRR